MEERTQFRETFPKDTTHKDNSLFTLFDADRVTFEPKKVIYNAGAKSDYFYFVINGLVKLISHLVSGKARIVQLGNAGSWLGLCGFLRIPCEHTAIAIDKVEVYQIRRQDMLRLKKTDPFAYCQVLEHWLRYLQQTDKWITDFSTGPLKSRLARLLSHLHELEGNVQGDEVKLLTCEELAEILGTTAESVSRVLAELKRNGVLQQVGSEHLYRYDIDIVNHLANS